MPSRFSDLFDAYDFFGKAIPGFVFFIGIIGLFPSESSLVSPPEDFTVRNFAVLAISAFTVGVIFGEGIHSLATTIERGVSYLKNGVVWLDSTVREFLRELVALFNYAYSPESHTAESPSEEPEKEGPGAEEDEDNSSNSQSKNKEKRSGRILLLVRAWRFLHLSSTDLEDQIDLSPIGLLKGFSGWMKRRLKTIEIGLVPHRQLFTQIVRGQLHPGYGRDDPEPHFERFRASFEDRYGIALQGDTPESEFRAAYPIITARLDVAESYWASSFQARYSFCRSMWVVLGLMTVFYLAAFVHEYTEKLSSRVATTDSLRLLESSNIGEAAVALSITVLLLSLLQLPFRSKYSEYNGLWELIPSVRLYNVIWLVAYIPMAGLIFRFGIASEVWKLIIHGLRDATLTAVRLLNYLVEIYLTILPTDGQTTADTVVAFDLLNGLETALIAALAISSMLYFLGAKSYKENYIEYLAIEFSELAKEDEVKDMPPFY